MVTGCRRMNRGRLFARDGRAGFGLGGNTCSLLGDFDDGGSGGGCFEGDFTGEDSLGGKEGGFESSSSSFFRSSLFLTSFIGDNFTPNVVLFCEAKSFFFRSSTGDTDFTVFMLAFEERESLLDVLLSFE